MVHDSMTLSSTHFDLNLIFDRANIFRNPAVTTSSDKEAPKLLDPLDRWDKWLQNISIQVVRQFRCFPLPNDGGTVGFRNVGLD